MASAAQTEPSELIGQSPAFLDVLAQISAAAPLNRPLLIIGERGAGKELLAARAHFLSTRWDGPFVKVNCAALSDDLLESELFGHEAGAFTGATRRLEGRFERADGGTLFLDEIASASLRVQEKLLRIIEYGEFERLGGGETLTVDVRIVGATNIDLPEAAAKGDFRADLLDRLAFDVITAPPLRARPEDILLLAQHFAAGMARELGADGFSGLSPQARAALLSHPWPGNVRELKNAVERSVYRSLAAAPESEDPLDEIILDPFTSDHRPLPPTATSSQTDAPAPPSDFAKAVRDYEIKLVSNALAAHKFNQKETAVATRAVL